MKGLNIVFAGTPEFGLPCLEALSKSDHALTAVFTQPDRPAGRGRKLQASAVKLWAQAQHLPIYQPLNFKDAAALNDLKNLAPDVLVVIAYGLILPQRVLDVPRLGCVNVHASLLPRWRGASPIQQAILAGDEETGVSIMKMDVGMDTGPYYTMRTCPILSSDTTLDLQERLSHLAVEPLLTTLDQLAAGKAETIPQFPEAIYAPTIKKEDARINWYAPAEVIDRQIRAYIPWPIAFTQIQDKIIRIHQAKILTTTSTAIPGTLLSIDAQGIQVATRVGTILMTRLQYPGGRPLTMQEFLNAPHPELTIGAMFQ